ncbi:MAG: hypothetical protein HY744_01895 [Deltaproteobacteria bacterium]|nr:hypothetical protein [Deltaproteobacteria bacterium]
MTPGIFSTACERFRASEKLDPAPGTTLNLAECEQRRGQLATAWELFRAVASKLPPGDPRRPVAERRLAELAPQLPRVYPFTGSCGGGQRPACRQAGGSPSRP